MKVLLAVDGSASSMEAAQFFCRLPHQDRLDLTVLTVIGLPDVPLTASTDLWYAKFLEGQQLQCDENYADMQELFEGANADLRHACKQGHVGHSITATADEMGADLIVMGSKGHSNLERVLLGSVSDYVATHASMSVLVVRNQELPRHRDIKMRIAVGYDHSTYSQVAIDQISKVTWAKNADVNVLSVVPLHRVIQHGLLPAAFEKSDDVVREAARYAEQAVKLLRDQGVHATSTVVEAEHVGERIVSVTDESNPDLIVLGNRGRSGIARALLGSVSQYVLRHSNHSIWIIRAEKT
ncbi:MAG: universal stress protein [Pirellulaceae bacterium]|nr:universal stress protein [Pirellulaceae bacterium]